MLDIGWLTHKHKDMIITEMDLEIADAFDYSKNSPFPSAGGWSDANYSSITPVSDQLLHDGESQLFDENQADTMPKPY